MSILTEEFRVFAHDDQLEKVFFFLQLIVMMKHVRTTPRVEPAPPASSAAPLPAGGWPAAACEAPSGQQRTLGSWAGWAEWAAEAVWLGPRAEQAVRYFVVAAVTTNVLVFPFVLAFHGPVPMSRKQAASQTIAQRPGQLALPPEAPSALDHASGCPKLTPQAPHPVSAKQPLLGRAGRPHILSNRESGLFPTQAGRRGQRGLASNLV